MAKKLTNRELEEVLESFLNSLRNKIEIQDSFLFGSYAKGTANENSDIDLLIISPDLPLNKPKGANGFYLAKLAGIENVYPGLEIIGVHPDKLSAPLTKFFFDEVLETAKKL
jgi:uncharacterized protein